MTLHCSAAYLASIVKAGCSDPLDEFTLEAVTVFNSLVNPASFVSVESLVDSGLSQKKTYLPELMTINLTSCAASHLWPTTPICYRRHLGAQLDNWQASCFDLTVVSLLNSILCAGATIGSTAGKAEVRKHDANDLKCIELG